MRHLNVVIDHIVKLGRASIVEVGRRIHKVAQNRSFELSDGGGESLIHGTVFPCRADERLEICLRVGDIGVEVDIPETEIRV